MYVCVCHSQSYGVQRDDFEDPSSRCLLHSLLSTRHILFLINPIVFFACSQSLFFYHFGEGLLFFVGASLLAVAVFFIVRLTAYMTELVSADAGTCSPQRTTQNPLEVSLC